MEYVPTKIQAKAIKKALVCKYGRANVRCSSERSWVHATVTVPAIAGLTEQETRRLAYEDANRIVAEAMKSTGATFSTFCADDGYNSSHDCFILQTQVAT